MRDGPAHAGRDLTISVVIPAYNAEQHLGAAIESVLAQDPAPLEVIVVDDGSQDATASVAQGFGDRVRLEQQRNAGVSRARNTGISVARGTHVAFLDADDVWLPGKLAAQLAAMEADPRLGYVYTGYRRVDARLLGLAPPVIIEPDEAVLRTLLLEPPGIWVSSTCLFPKAVLDEVGGFDERLSTSADVDLAVRVGLRYPVAGINEPLVLYRQHAEQMHLGLDAMAHDMSVIYGRVFDAPEARPVAHLRGRAWANLHTTLALGFARQGRLGEASRRLVRAFGADPHRTSWLLVAAARRRAPRRARRRG